MNCGICCRYFKWRYFLRRYGVVEGRFCFEGGSLCGKGEGLHVLITDQAREIAHDFNLAAQGRLSPRRRPYAAKKNEGNLYGNHNVVVIIPSAVYETVPT